MRMYSEPKPRLKPSDILGKFPAGNKRAREWGLDDPTEAFFIGILAILGIAVFAGIATIAAYLFNMIYL